MTIASPVPEDKLDLSIRVDKEGRYIPAERKKTKTFEDVSLEHKLADFNSPSGRHFMRNLPTQVGEAFRAAALETGINSREAAIYLDYALSQDEFGEIVSPIARSVYHNPHDPYAFWYIYQRESARTALDFGFIITHGAQAIKNRLDILVNKLPGIIRAEIVRLGIKPGEKFRILNIGAAYSLDTTLMIASNPDLKEWLEVVCVEPHIPSIEQAKTLAWMHGANHQCKFISKRIENCDFEPVNMILFIGMACSMVTPLCVRYFKSFKNY